MTKEQFSRYIVYDGGIIFDKIRGCNIKIFNSNGYHQCRLISDEGKEHILGVHSVVAMFHCPDYFEGCIVHHEDEDKQNNWAYNLKCITRSAHSKKHANTTRLRDYVLSNGPANKGKKMSDEFKEKCRQSAIRRGFNGNQYIHKSPN